MVARWIMLLYCKLWRARRLRDLRREVWMVLKRERRAPSLRRFPLRFRVRSEVLSSIYLESRCS